MFLAVPWEILILGKIVRCMSCIIKSNYIVNSCNSFSKNREKLSDYSKWTDYLCRSIIYYSAFQTFRQSALRKRNENTENFA